MSNNVKNMTEVYFEWWLQEMKDYGLVKEFEFEPKTFVLENAIPVYYEQNYKTKDPLIKPFNLFGPLTYTPDYRVVFSGRLVDKLIGLIENRQLTSFIRGNAPGNVYQQVLFYSDVTIPNGQIDEQTILSQDFEVWFDVKPPSKALRYSGSLGSSRDFKYVSRLMYNNHGIVINKVVPVGSKTSLFTKTFLPHRYKFTDKSMQTRKLKNYEKKSRDIKQYINEKEI